ncbi:MAG: 4-alpha-glucanotransferase, partial [Spirochaetota bacterium]
PAELTPELAQKVILRILDTNSAICMFQIQDFFALSEDLRPADPADERVNIPGTATEFNWSYRLPRTIEALMEETELNTRIRRLVEARRSAVPNIDIVET